MDPGFPRLYLSFAATLCGPCLAAKPGTEEAPWLHQGETEAAGNHRIGAGNCPLRTVPLLIGRDLWGSYLLQRVHHGLQVHALGQLLLPSVRAKKDRRSEGASHASPASRRGGSHPGPVPGTAVTPPRPALQELPSRGWGQGRDRQVDTGPNTRRCG